MDHRSLFGAGALLDVIAFAERESDEIMGGQRFTLKTLRPVEVAAPPEPPR